MELQQLSAPFAPEEIDWRVGSTNAEKTRGMALAYLDARSVMKRLDEVCGPQGWQCRYSHAANKTVCEIGIKCGDEWVWKADGAGDSDFEAEKGALSDAFKRAAVRWGIGRYLYDLAAPWVEVEQKGKSTFIKKTEFPKLEALLRGQKAPSLKTWTGPMNEIAAIDETVDMMDIPYFDMNGEEAGALRGVATFFTALYKDVKADPRFFISNEHTVDLLESKYPTAKCGKLTVKKAAVAIRELYAPHAEIVA